MGTSLEDLRMLKDAETVADGIWEEVISWDTFIRNTVGEQLVRASDSIGANIAEGYGRFHYGEKLRFLYYARGSLYETKYWLNRCLKRELIAKDTIQKNNEQLNGLSRQINAFAASLKSQKNTSNQVRETESVYTSETFEDSSLTLFDEG